MDHGLVDSFGLGALFGTTTFLPVSTNGHRDLAELLFNLAPTSPMQELALLFGVLGATLIVVRHALAELGSALVRVARRPGLLWNDDESRPILNLAIGQLPIFLLGYWMRQGGPLLERQPTLLAIGLFLTVGILLSTAWIEPGQRSSLSNSAAAMLGFAQAVSAFPGLSAPGSTIVLGLWLGLSRRCAFEFALLLSIPAMVVRMVMLSLAVVHVEPIHRLLLASVVSLVTGIGAATTLRVAVLRGLLASFTLWVAPLAVATFALARAWPAP